VFILPDNVSICLMTIRTYLIKKGEIKMKFKSKKPVSVPLAVALVFCLSISMTMTVFAEASVSNFVKTQTYAPGAFTDVNENQWYGFNKQKVIAIANEYGLMKGNSATTFNPTGNINLAEAITIAARVHRIYTEGADDFVQSGSPWYKVYTDYAANNRIIESGMFPDFKKPATRAEMAYIFSHSMPEAEFAIINTVNTLPDVSAKNSYFNEIILLYGAGVLGGSDAKGTFGPDNNVTRAEVAAIISRVILPDDRFSGRTY